MTATTAAPERATHKPSPSFEHFIRLARRGKHRGSSGGEKQARRIAEAMLENMGGLDDSAIVGACEFAKLVYGNYDVLNEMIG